MPVAGLKAAGPASFTGYRHPSAASIRHPFLSVLQLPTTPANGLLAVA